MLKGRGRAQIMAAGPTAMPAQNSMRRGATTLTSRAPLARPEPDYEVVEFPTEQYVNAKIHPPPPPPRPPTGHPIEASCGLCGGGGARVRCAECGRRALCASCDDMYHRHPKRRHHQRQAIASSQLREERPPLPPKSAAPVPPPRRHKLGGDRSTASPRPQDPRPDMRRATLGSLSPQNQGINLPLSNNLHFKQQSQIPNHLTRLQATSTAPQLGSVPYLPSAIHQNAPVPQMQMQNNTLGHPSAVWNRPRGSLQGFNLPPNIPMPSEPWDAPGNISPSGQNWGRPLRRGASVLELGGGTPCPGCAHCGPLPWRYGSCANLDHPWMGGWQPSCCPPPHSPVQHTMSLHHHHQHQHPSQTPQPYRRAESRAVSRAASRVGSRAASPAMSIRSRTSRRTKHRTPSPVALPSSDADSESEDESDHIPPHKSIEKTKEIEEPEKNSLGPIPAPPNASWQCEHCTFVNEPGVRVCTVCCRTPTVAPKVVAENISNNISQMTISGKKSSTSVDKIMQDSSAKQDEERIKTRSKKDRTSTGCGPSPPRDTRSIRPVNRLETPTRENTHTELPIRHDMAVGSSPPREVQIIHQNNSPPPVNLNRVERVTPRPEESKVSSQHVQPTRHSISVGPSPPRDVSSNLTTNNWKTEKVSIATSTPVETNATLPSSTSTRARVSNTGTSPPPQSISTQTYEDPNTWERAPSSARSRPQRRRFKDEGSRERSHSRHSLSSDTRESDRSARTSGGRWEWREPRDSSPGGDWSENEKRRAASRLTRRASHLDLRRTRSTRRSSHYGSEAASPEPLSVNRTISLEALTASGARREAEKGLELARLLTDAERLGFSAAEVHAALAQNPVAPLSWLRERWPSLCAGVRAAAARLAPGINVSELEARAALARHRGAMWPAVTECVEKHRRQPEIISVGEERRLRGHVWGSPVGADDDAAPPHRSTHHSHRMREDSSDEFDVPTPNKSQDDDWMYLPLETQFRGDVWNMPVSATAKTNEENTEEIAQKLKMLLFQAGVPSIDEKLLLKGLLADNTVFKADNNNTDNTFKKAQTMITSSDLGQSENDFIDAYNALTRLSPLPNINTHKTNIEKIDKTDITQYDQKSVDRTTNSLNRADTSNTTTIEMVPIFDEQKQPHHNNTTIEINMKVEENKSTGNIEKTEKLFVSNSQKQNNRTKSDKNALSNIKKTNKVLNKYDNSKTSEVKQKSTINKTIIPMPHISNITSKTSEPSIENEFETIIPNEEKSSNLSDIVDNTQKLIQQMKEEINSDINSLDDSNIMSQSEAENSENDSEFSTEQESSYSDTEQEETDELTSERHDSSSSEDEGEKKDTGGNKTAIMNRTSSEDNEQFEEAMDHLDGQLDDFKQTNIEMLDSIARSLQEEHTLSVHVSDLNTSQQKRHDFNNNFSKVTSFEEIYDEMLVDSEEGNYNAHIQNNQNSQNLQDTNVENTQTINKSLERNNELLQAKREIYVNVYKAESPRKILITDHKKLSLNALIENNIKRIEYVQTTSRRENNDVHDNLQSNNANDSLNVQINSPFEITSPRKDNDFDFIDNTTDITNVRDEVQAIVETASDVSLQHDASVESVTAFYKEDTPTELLNINNDDSQETFLINNNPIDKQQSDSNIITQENGLHSNETIVEENEHYDNQKTDNLENIPGNESQLNDNQLQNTSSDGTQVPNDSNVANNVSDPSLTPINENAIASEKSIITAIKSNIPKLIKSLQNDKTKAEKNPPIKNINSKLPVRRTSTKQYAAPAPPKAHFGNIQSGHVKHLQTRLFNNKSNVHTNQSTADSIPTTSYTLNKKKPAPPPPSKNEDRQQSSSPPKTSVPKKKSYFRETCRTEDEWTGSDSEGTPPPFIRSTEESEPAPSSPPPPITLRRVSGQLIDLARVRLPEGSPERQARMLLAEGATENWEQARLAVELVSRGTEPPVALLAALECIDLAAALAYLQQDCELCASRLPEHEMVSMLRCTHRCCRECARHYFTVQITERSIADCICPYCKEPELESLPEDEWLEYFAHLDILLKMLLEAGVHELFQRKLRDRTLARDPNFRWCVECSSGFFVHPKQKKLRCPECRSVSCSSCRKPWTSNHDGLTCEQYAVWLEDNDTERSAAAVQQHLRENGLECPRCRFKYSLSRGGCMHFTCTQCKYEFCYGCDKPFMMGAQCGLSEYCAKLGLHAHHPRNCLFYLRDKEPHELQTLLQMNNVTYETEATEGSSNRCPIQLQRETPTGLVDGACGSETPPRHAGLCKVHYVEYLAGLARGLDPIPIMEVSELVAELRRRALPLPERGPWDTDPIYAGMCAEIVKEKIPLD